MYEKDKRPIRGNSRIWNKCRMDMVVVSATGAGVRILRMGSGRATSFLGGVRQIFQVISRLRKLRIR